jgi:hypothetical protein
MNCLASGTVRLANTWCQSEWNPRGELHEVALSLAASGYREEVVVARLGVLPKGRYAFGLPLRIFLLVHVSARYSEGFVRPRLSLSHHHVDEAMRVFDRQVPEDSDPVSEISSRKDHRACGPPFSRNKASGTIRRRRHVLSNVVRRIFPRFFLAMNPPEK